MGHDEDAVPEVRGTKGRRRYALPLRIVPDGGQVPENLPKGGPSIGREYPRYVLHEDVSGSKIANDAGELRPEPSVVLPRLPLPRRGDGLAREPAGDEVHRSELRAPETTDIPEPRHVRPMSSKNCLTVRVDLDLPSAPPSGPLKPEINPADAGEEAPESRPVIHEHHPPPRSEPAG